MEASSRPSSPTSSGPWGIGRSCAGGGDQGVDIVVNPRGERTAVQCKNHSKPVGNRPVQEVHAGACYHRWTAAWVVAPAGYTRGALALAQSTGVSLYDANAIHRWIKNVDKLEKERASETRPATSRPAPTNTPIDEEARKGQEEGLLVPAPRRPAGALARGLTQVELGGAWAWPSRFSATRGRVAHCR
jgi:hypothetical protein